MRIYFRSLSFFTQSATDVSNGKRVYAITSSYNVFYLFVANGISLRYYQCASCYSKIL
jgi:hypothetical protein